MFTKTIGLFATAVAAAALGTAAVTLPASGQAPKSDSDIAASVSDAFPYVAPVAAHSPTTRLAVDDREVVAEGAIGPNAAFSVQATRDGNVCAVYNGTSTCAPAAGAAKSGLFIGEIRCSGPQAGSATVFGATPRGVQKVSSAAGQTDTGPNGFVTFEVTGARVAGISLDNGHVAPLVLDPDLCHHRAIVKPAS